MTDWGQVQQHTSRPLSEIRTKLRYPGALSLVAPRITRHVTAAVHDEASCSSTAPRATTAGRRPSAFLRSIIVLQPDSWLALARENGSLPGRDPHGSLGRFGSDPRSTGQRMAQLGPSPNGQEHKAGCRNWRCATCGNLARQRVLWPATRVNGISKSGAGGLDHRQDAGADRWGIARARRPRLQRIRRGSQPSSRIANGDISEHQ